MDNNIKNIACVPNSFFIVIDDLGWWCGDDDREKNGPSRSGIGRRHVPEDYSAIIALGKALDMRIKCAFVIGEWDRTNLLAKVPHSNMHHANWDNASRLDSRIDEARDIINAGDDYMEITLHGCMHMYWREPYKMEYAEFYQRIDNTNDIKMTDPEIAIQHLDAFFNIMRQNGLTAKVNSFVPPCFIYTFSRGNDHLSYYLKDYGIQYISTPFSSMKYTTPEKPSLADVENSIITVDRAVCPIPWQIVDSPVPEQSKTGFFGAHWPNFLHMDPSRSLETVDRWVKYFNGYRNNFDSFSAYDTASASVQALYKRFTRVDINDNAAGKNVEMVLDFTEINPLIHETRLAKNADCNANNTFYLNIKNGVVPSSDKSAVVTPYKTHTAHTTYRLERKEPLSNVTKLYLNY